MNYSKIQPKSGLIVTFATSHDIPEESEMPATSTLKPGSGMLVNCDCGGNVFLPHAYLDGSEELLLVATKCKCGKRMDDAEAFRRFHANNALWGARYEEVQE